jgi:hypothetical protein
MLDRIADLLITIYNGTIGVLAGVFDLFTILVALSALSLVWLAACEIERLDRRGYKPGVRAH